MERRGGREGRGRKEEEGRGGRDGRGGEGRGSKEEKGVSPVLAMVPIPARGNNEASSTDVPKPPVVEASEGSLTFACTYMGFCEVTKPSGMDLLNEAVEQLLMNTAHWVNIQLEVTDSCIKIVEGKVGGPRVIL